MSAFMLSGVNDKVSVEAKELIAIGVARKDDENRKRVQRYRKT